MYKTVFHISKMDCPSEENLIRIKLGNLNTIQFLEFDLANRNLTVFHKENLPEIEDALREIRFGEKRISTEQTDKTSFTENASQRNLLWTVLGINFSFFVLEMITGWLSNSIGLVADSLDMLADSFVYGISLLAVGGTLLRKKQIAKTAGVFQLTLALIGFAEVLRRFFTLEALPNFTTMLVVSILALVANAICLYLMQRSKSKEEAHIKASLIFTSNDIIINAGVIIAALLVNWLHSPIPDLVIGTLVFALVMQGALRILKLGK